MLDDLTTPGGLLAEEIAKLTTRRIERAVAEIEVPAGKDGLGFDLKTYAKGQVYREGDYIATAWGKIYVAVRDTADAPRKSDAWKRVGPWGLEFLGLKPEDVNTLECGDLYIDGGSLFGVLPDGRVKMLVQRGKEGKQGPAGRDGKDGRHGASIIAGVEIENGIRLRSDDGTDIDVPLPMLHEKIYGIVETVAKNTTNATLKAFFEAIEVDDEAVAVRAHRGPWLPGTSYSKGDLVNRGNALYLCTAAQVAGQVMSYDNWRKIAGGSGGNGSGGALYELPVASETELGGVKIGSGISVLADGTISTAALPGTGTDLAYTPSTRLLESSSGNDVTLPLVVAGGNAGLMEGAQAAQLADHESKLSTIDADELAAINGANAPSAGNVFATMDDVAAAGGVTAPPSDPGRYFAWKDGAWVDITNKIINP